VPQLILGGHGIGRIDGNVRISCDYYRVSQSGVALSPTVSIGYIYEAK